MDAIQSANFELEFETKLMGYLGEKFQRTDMVFNNVKFDLELHLHNQDFVPFTQALLDKAQRLTPDIQFNITGLFAFPNGQSPQFTMSDCAFGPIPFNVSARGDYVKFKIEGVCSQLGMQTS